MSMAPLGVMSGTNYHPRNPRRLRRRVTLDPFEDKFDNREYYGCGNGGIDVNATVENILQKKK